MRGIENVRGQSAHDPDSRYGNPKVGATPRHPLDSEPMRVLAAQLEDWWVESRDRHAHSRAERLIDHDYYDHEQISAEDRAVYEERGQAPLVFNLIHPAVDWLCGTERRTRIDWKVLPRGEEDLAGANAQTQLLKFVSDANRAPWERSRAFKDAVISGVGFVEEYLASDPANPVGFGYQDWRYLWWDPYSRDNDFGDCRYIHRAKLVDLDYAIAMLPDRAADLSASAVSYVDTDLELMDDLDGLPALFALSERRPLARTMTGLLRERSSRRRVRLIETWYRAPQVTRKVHARIAEYADLEGITFEASAHAELLERGAITLVDALTTKMMLAIWSPGIGLCQLSESPYPHNEFPFTAVWCYRHHRDGMPYGFVRGMRDPQDEYNKRRAKALFSASVNRVLYESDAFDEDDERDSLDEISKPNGEVRLAPGALQQQKLKIETGLEVASTHVNFMTEAKQHIFEGNGITRENLGQETNAISGRAIVAKQQQGAVTTAEVFDNFRMLIQVSGEKLLALTRVGMALPRQVRVLGENGLEWLAINQPQVNPETGEVEWVTDILETKADFVVGEQDWRESWRQAMAETLLETIGKLPPETALQFLDLAIELMDLPNKDEFLRRARMVNGQTPDPAAQAAQARAAQLDEALREAKVSKERAGAAKLQADAQRIGVEGKANALNTAGLLEAAMPLVPAADALYAGALASPPQPVQTGVTTE